MPSVKINTTSESKTFHYNVGDSLLSILTQHHIHVTTPCGGNGTCGKCLVYVKKVGYVNSCTYYPEEDIEVLAPSKQEAKILTEQHSNTIKLPLENHPLSNTVSYPIGVGIDIGTTTIVFYFLNLIMGSLIKCKSTINPQGRHGADVISRISYCTSNDKLLTLQKELTDVINATIQDFTKSENISPENITKLSVSANATMLHLLAGENPRSLAVSPFKAVFTEKKIFTSKQLGIEVNKEAIITLLPSISAFVGADIVSGIATLKAPDTHKNYLYLDIGTNGEMALITPQEILCCATAAGPAFEGANISCGMGAFNGAITSFGKNGYHTIANEKPIGICGSGLLDIVAYLIKNEKVEKDGLLKSDYVIADKKASGNGRNIVITPQDIREVQLAKSAIYTGIKLLVNEANMEFEDIDAVYLAGGLGNYLNPESAMIIGLLPAVFKNKTIPIGNTSGLGALLHCTSSKFENYCQAVIDKSRLIDLAKHPDFELEFAMNMYFD